MGRRFIVRRPASGRIAGSVPLPVVVEHSHTAATLAAAAAAERRVLERQPKRRQAPERAHGPDAALAQLRAEQWGRAVEPLRPTLYPALGPRWR